MSLFESPDDRLRRKLRNDLLEPAGRIAELAERYGEGSYAEKRRLAYFLFATWIRAQVEAKGMDVIGTASLREYSACVDQAGRIGRQFNDMQRLSLQVALEVMQENPETFALGEET